MQTCFSGHEDENSLAHTPFGTDYTQPLTYEKTNNKRQRCLNWKSVTRIGHFTRANFSLRQDIADLFGADLPVEGGTAGQFAWRDGPLLRALREGHWVLLDEVICRVYA